MLLLWFFLLPFFICGPKYSPLRISTSFFFIERVTVCLRLVCTLAKKLSAVLFCFVFVMIVLCLILRQKHFSDNVDNLSRSILGRKNKGNIPEIRPWNGYVEHVCNYSGSIPQNRGGNFVRLRVESSKMRFFP